MQLYSYSTLHIYIIFVFTVENKIQHYLYSTRFGQNTFSSLNLFKVYLMFCSQSCHIEKRRSSLRNTQQSIQPATPMSLRLKCLYLQPVEGSMILSLPSVATVIAVKYLSCTRVISSRVSVYTHTHKINRTISPFQMEKGNIKCSKGLEEGCSWFS